MKLCECGECGLPAPIATKTDSSTNRVKGEPMRFVIGHHARRPLVERFWGKVDTDGPILNLKLGRCWLWTGSANEYGYGHIVVGGRKVRATHVAMYLQTGEWPILRALHKCDNPPCVRFSHLFLGTQSTNMYDSINKGRRSQVLLTQERATAIRSEYALGASKAVLSKLYGVTVSCIEDVVYGKSWTSKNLVEEKS